MKDTVFALSEEQKKRLMQGHDPDGKALPDVPTVSEFVPGYEASQWYGIGAPKNTGTDIVVKLNREINAGLTDPKLKAQLADLGETALGGSSAEFEKLIAEQTEKWAKVVKFSGANAD